MYISSRTLIHLVVEYYHKTCETCDLASGQSLHNFQGPLTRSLWHELAQS